jgi:serine/threonine protein kinase
LNVRRLEIAVALDHAHHQGLIHRDLKPSNIQVTPNDHAKLLDLGLAIMQGETCTAREVVGGQGYVVGTMDYIAPEQIENAAGVDPRSDIYALGSTLYYALTGRPPFPGGTVLEKFQRHRTEEPLPIEQINPSVPVRFRRVVRRMMAKKPEDRFQTAHAIREELQAWVNGEPERPLDRVGDTQYAQAIHELEVAEPSIEVIEEPLPVVESGPVGTAILISEELPVSKLLPVAPRSGSVKRENSIAPPEGRRIGVGVLLLVLAGIAAAAVGMFFLLRH